MSLLDEVVSALTRGGVSHAVIGAAALSLYGVARSTFDTDILVTDRRVLDPHFWGDCPAGMEIELRRGDEVPLARRRPHSSCRRTAGMRCDRQLDVKNFE